MSTVDMETNMHRLVRSLALMFLFLPGCSRREIAGKGVAGITQADGNGFVDFTLNLLSIWPALIILCVLLYLLVKWIKRLRHKNANKKDAATLPTSKL
jgi:hypothetical protein